MVKHSLKILASEGKAAGYILRKHPTRQRVQALQDVKLIFKVGGNKSAYAFLSICMSKREREREREGEGEGEGGGGAATSTFIRKCKLC